MASIDTKNLDVVYFCRPGSNEELRYSLRSVEKNLAHRLVWIYGGKPNSIEPDRFVQREPAGKTKWDRVRTMFRDVCLNDDITDDFILMNDDFFVMKKTAKLEAYHRSSLYEHIVRHEQKYNDRVNQYTLQLRKAVRALQDANLPTLSYELHVPMIMNKQKLLEVMGAFPNIHCTRSLYGNYVGLESIQLDDVKVYDKHQPFDKRGRFLSSDDDSWEVSDAGKWIREKFNEKGGFEL